MKEPLLPNTKTDEIFYGGVVDVDARLRKSALFDAENYLDFDKISPMMEPTALKVKYGRRQVGYEQPLVSDLWYIWNFFRDDNPIDLTDEQISTLEESLSNVKFVKTAQNKQLSQFKKRAFPLTYEWVPDGKPSSVKTKVPCVACLEFMGGDLFVVAGSSLLGEVTGAVGEVRGGGDIIPSKPAAVSFPEINKPFYGVTGDNEVLKKTALNPFSVTRVIIKDENTYPTPGEFLGLAMSMLPNHAWFNQESNPFIFSGNWFETNYYTGGIVTAREDISDAGDESDFSYTVRIHGVEIPGVKSTDFFLNEIEDRVTILKTLDNDEVFNNSMLLDFNTGWRIIPISFYED